MQALTGETVAHSLIPQVAPEQVGACEDWLGFGGVNCLRRLFRGWKREPCSLTQSLDLFWLMHDVRMTFLEQVGNYPSIN